MKHGYQTYDLETMAHELRAREVSNAEFAKSIVLGRFDVTVHYIDTDFVFHTEKLENEKTVLDVRIQLPTVGRRHGSILLQNRFSVSGLTNDRNMLREFPQNEDSVERICNASFVDLDVSATRYFSFDHEKIAMPLVLEEDKANKYLFDMSGRLVQRRGRFVSNTSIRSTNRSFRKTWCRLVSVSEIDAIDLRDVVLEQNESQEHLET